MQPDQYCQDRAAKSGSSFYYSFRFLPTERRHAVTALYAFCREVDDVVDECSDPVVAAQTLVWWRTEVEKCFEGEPQHPVTQALKRWAKEFDLPKHLFIEIIDGMEMDLQQNRYTDFEELRRYCYHVASAVGLLSARILGFQNDVTLQYAEKLGLAFQLTNIIRDVGQDVRLGRIYLPLDEMATHGVTEQELFENKTTPALRTLLADLTQRARQYYAEAEALLPAEDRAQQRTGLIMAAIYATLLDEIERDGFCVLERRVHLTPIRKLWIAWRTARRERRLA